jgi:beta-mannosidase
MNRKIELENNWLLKYTEYGKGQRFGFESIESKDGWIPAHVPGDVHLDLMDAGVISDPFYGLNSDHCIWMEEKDWWYRTTFSLSGFESIKSNQSIFLMFHGLDTFATIYFNEEKIGTHNNMFVPLKLDITQKIRAGENDLRVCLASPTYSPDIHRDPDIARTPLQRLYSRKAQSSYGWDIAPRLVTIGIWRPVEIIVCDKLEIIDSWIQTKQITRNGTDVELEFWISANDENVYSVSVDIEVFNQKRSIQLEIESKVVSQKELFVLDNPPLWWPHNHGAPNLLDYSIKIRNGEQIVDFFEGHFGVRIIELVQKPLENGRTSFFFKINNKPIFLKGMNWTPCDAIYSRITDEKYSELLTTTVESNINALRVWGGGIYESDTFYDLCDKLGILVWQDFMFACGVYPQDQDFLEEIEYEAEHVVKNLRQHPSIFVWCGDNEVDWVYLQENVPDYQNNKINRKILPAVCKKLDSSRPYIPSSPFSKNDEYPNDPDSGNVHLWKHGSSFKDDFYADCSPNMVTEIGYISLPHRDLIESVIPKEKLWPPYNEYWYLHCSDPLRSGESYRVQSWFNAISHNGLPEPDDLDALISYTQQLQAEATAFWIENFSKQPDCWGIFLWNLCDCWPQIADAYISYDLHKKPALKAVKDGYEKISV